MSSIDVTSNPQYIALQQSYQDQLSTVDQIQQLQDQLTKLSDDAQTNPNNQASDIQQIQDLQNKIKSLDPDGKYTNTDGSFKDANQVADLTTEENNALASLGAVLNGQAAIEQANQAVADINGPNMQPDIFTRVQMVFAQMGQASDTVAQGYIDQVSNNVAQIDQINALSQAVNDAKPTGTDPTKTAPISASVIQQLQDAGVQMPSDIKENSDGTYTMSQADYSTVQTNVQSQCSSLTTLNQNISISMNKAIDVSQQCTTFQSSSLEQWSQLVQKIASAM